MALLTTLLQLAGLLGFTWWLLAQYKDPHVTPAVHGAVFVSWALGFLGLLLLPVDLAENGFVATTAPAVAGVGTVGNASASANETVALLSAGTPPEDHVRYLWAWQVLYWLTFALSWLVLPFLAEFCQNGEFLLDRRILSSLKRLVLHWTILAAVGGVVVVYLVFVGHFSLFGLIGLAMASANTYGLLWLIALLGFGLVDIPRSFWTLRFPANRLKELHFRAVQVYEERMEAIFNHEDVVGAVHDCYERMLHAEGISIILTSDMQFIKSCLLRVKELADRHDGDNNSDSRESPSSSVAGLSTSWQHSTCDHRVVPRRAATVTGSPFTSSMRTPTMSEVVDLHHRVLLATAERRRSEQAWIELCIQANFLHSSVTERELPPASLYPETSVLNDTRNVVLAVRHRLGRLALEPISICCAAVAGAASLCIVWGELMMGVSDGSTSIYRAFSREWGANASELLAFAMLLYMVVCSYSSLFKLRGFGRFAVRSHHGSTDLCLLKTSIYQCRLQFAVGYNFLLLLGDRALTDRTAFAMLFENMRVVHVLGRGFSVYAPTLMVVLVGLALSDGYARVMKRLGVEQYEQVILGSADHEAVIIKGEMLVQQGLERYRTHIRRRKITGASGSGGYYYGFAKTTSDGAQALLDGDSSDEVDLEQSREYEASSGSQVLV